jgi:hypothetical protein
MERSTRLTHSLPNSLNQSDKASEQHNTTQQQQKTPPPAILLDLNVFVLISYTGRLVSLSRIINLSVSIIRIEDRSLVNRQ